MNKIIGASTVALLLAVGAASAQNTIQNNGVRGSGNAVGEKESYQAKDPARVGRGSTSQSIPGAVGAGANVTGKETYHGGDPSRSGRSGAGTNPKGAGSVGDTGTGQ